MFSIYFFGFLASFGLSICTSLWNSESHVAMFFLLAILNWLLCFICLFLFLVFFGYRKKSLFEEKGIEKNVKCFWSFFQWKVREKKELESVRQKKVDCFKINFFVCVRPPFWRIFIIPSSHLLQIIFLGCKQIFLL